MEYSKQAARTRGKIGKLLLEISNFYTNKLNLPIVCNFNYDYQQWELQQKYGSEKDKVIYVYPNRWSNQVTIVEVWFEDYSQENILKHFTYETPLGTIVDFILKQFNW